MGRRRRKKKRGVEPIQDPTEKGAMEEKFKAAIHFLTKGPESKAGKKKMLGWMPYMRDRRVPGVKQILSIEQADEADLQYTPAQFIEWEYDYMIFDDPEEIEQSIRLELKEDPELDEDDFLKKAIYMDEDGRVVIPQFICKSEVVDGEVF